MSGWFTTTGCIVHVSLSLVTVVVASLGIVAGYSRQGFLENRNNASFHLPKKCGIYQQKLFCFSTNLCNKYCSQQCSRISSFELRNLQILSSEARRIRKLPNNMPLDTNLRINYYDVEMVGMNPALCGDYSTLMMPTYSIKESKSGGTQFLHKLYFQNYRDVYTHSMCNYKCIFDCRQVGYDEDIITELLVRNTPDLHVYQCDSVHSWVFIVVVIVIFFILLIIIACFMRNKMSNIHGITKDINV